MKLESIVGQMSRNTGTKITSLLVDLVDLTTVEVPEIIWFVMSKTHKDIRAAAIETFADTLKDAFQSVFWDLNEGLSQ